MQDRYLPNLNGMRAISVLLVVFGHATRLQTEFGGYEHTDWMYVPNKFGVAMFFCISGILISYLLDKDERENGEINIKQFYVRRIARIWPLYFMVVIPALLLNLALYRTTLATPMNGTDIFFMLTILPGFAERPMFVGPTWSIGIEESFYAIFPLMMCYLSRRTVIAILFAVAFSPELFSILGQFTCPALCNPRFWWSPEWYGCIAIGCLTYLIYRAGDAQINQWLFSPGVQATALAAIAALTAAAVYAAKFFDYRIISVPLAIVALNGAFNPKSILWIENRATKFIGEISYGMYMYHVYCTCLALMICWIFFRGERFGYQNLIVTGLATIITIIVAKWSYDHIEQPIRQMARSGVHGSTITAPVIGPVNF